MIIRHAMRQIFSFTLPGAIKFSRWCRQQQMWCNFNGKLRNSLCMLTLIVSEASEYCHSLLGYLIVHFSLRN